ncbi:hypothetical protein QFC21_002452 [Naganishia friedmannii]|uniref:Uncharacterized protein n=1 Tax=Naganishia friedmannii TaxID=89922 RepID=A0ACC2VWZ8_9TREE|nr:hypothetical protein QFC21_002452 [Naganishia friedmannii]
MAPHDLRFYWKVKAWTDFLQACMTFIFTLFLSVEFGLVASVCFSLILVIRKSTQARIKILGRLKDSDQWIPVDEHPDEEVEEDIPGVLVVRIRENLNFANTGQLKERLRRLEIYGPGKFHPSDAPRRDGATAVVFHMNDVEDIDASYTERGVGMYFVHMRNKQLEAFRIIQIDGIIGQNHFLPDLRSAMAAISDETSSLDRQDNNEEPASTSSLTSIRGVAPLSSGEYKNDRLHIASEQGEVAMNERSSLHHRDRRQRDDGYDAV